MMKNPRHKGKDTYHTKRAKLAQQIRADRKAHSGAINRSNVIDLDYRIMGSLDISERWELAGVALLESAE